MASDDTEELTAGQYIIRWNSILIQRFDATAFKKTMDRYVHVTNDSLVDAIQLFEQCPANADIPVPTF